MKSMWIQGFSGFDFRTFMTLSWTSVGSTGATFAR